MHGLDHGNAALRPGSWMLPRWPPRAKAPEAATRVTSVTFGGGGKLRREVVKEAGCINCQLFVLTIQALPIYTVLH